MTFPTVRSAAARVGRLRTTRKVDDPELLDAHQELATANLAAAIQQQLDDCPITIRQASYLYGLITERVAR